MYQSHYCDLRINSKRKRDDGPATAKREANYVTYVMTGQCVIIKSSISCQECALLRDRPAIGHYADSIMPILLPVTPEEKRVDWWRAPGPSQQCFNSRAIVCHLKNSRKKREGKGRRERGREGEGEREKERETAESGRHNSTVSENGEKWLGVSSVGSRVGLFFFGELDVFFEENGVKPNDRGSRSHCRGLDFATIIRGAETRDRWSRRKYGVLPAEFASFYLAILSSRENRIINKFLNLIFFQRYFSRDF